MKKNVICNLLSENRYQQKITKANGATFKSDPADLNKLVIHT